MEVRGAVGGSVRIRGASPWCGVCDDGRLAAGPGRGVDRSGARGIAIDGPSRSGPGPGSSGAGPGRSVRAACAPCLPEGYQRDPDGTFAAGVRVDVTGRGRGWPGRGRRGRAGGRAGGGFGAGGGAGPGAGATCAGTLPCRDPARGEDERGALSPGESSRRSRASSGRTRAVWSRRRAARDPLNADRKAQRVFPVALARPGGRSFSPPARTVQAWDAADGDGGRCFHHVKAEPRRAAALSFGRHSTPGSGAMAERGTRRCSNVIRQPRGAAHAREGSRETRPARERGAARRGPRAGGEPRGRRWSARTAARVASAVLRRRAEDASRRSTRARRRIIRRCAAGAARSGGGPIRGRPDQGAARCDRRLGCRCRHPRWRQHGSGLRPAAAGRSAAHRAHPPRRGHTPHRRGHAPPRPHFAPLRPRPLPYG